MRSISRVAVWEARGQWALLARRQAVTPGEGGGVHPATGVDLAVDAGDVMLDGAPADDELLCDLQIALPGRDQPQHLDLTRREVRRRPGPRIRRLSGA